VLALGIGANVTVFSLFNSLALKPIPGVEGSAGLGVLVARTDAGRILPLSYPDFRVLREKSRAFAGLAATSMDGYSVGLGTHGDRVFGEMVTGNYFSVLGVRASLGRTLQPSDDVAPGKHPVVVISDAMWRSTFASDPGIVGGTIQVNAYPFTIVGVTEPGFHGSIVSLRMDLFLPVMMQPQLRRLDLLGARESPMLWGLGRLQAEASIASAADEADLLSTRLDAQQPARRVSQRATVIPMWRSPYGAQTYMLPAILMLSMMARCFSSSSAPTCRTSSSCAGSAVEVRSRRAWPLAPAAAGSCDGCSSRALCCRCQARHWGCWLHAASMFCSNRRHWRRLRPSPSNSTSRTIGLS
jgi:hypothetical protein